MRVQASLLRFVFLINCATAFFSNPRFPHMHHLLSGFGMKKEGGSGGKAVTKYEKIAIFSNRNETVRHSPNLSP